MPYETTKSKSTSRQIGDAYERLACELLRADGYRIVETNYQVARVGEIDIIADKTFVDKFGTMYQVLVCAEVKARKHQAYGTAVQMVTSAKQKRLIKTMQYFLMNHRGYENASVRFDVIGFDDGKPTWIVGAFEVV